MRRTVKNRRGATVAERHSGLERMPADTYVTPRWVYEALYIVEPWAREAWDCAPVDADFDFLTVEQFAPWQRSIATNPPYNQAVEFCRRAISVAPRVAMLLSNQFDTARGRSDLFAKCDRFKVKYVVTKRIRWDNLSQAKAGPSQNHACYVWDSEHTGCPRIAWL
jgi:hypothetical protein